MERVVERVRAVGARRAALIVVIAAAVAVGFYFGAREADVGPRTEAGVVASNERDPEPAQQDESGEGNAVDEAGTLTLTLIAPEICDVERASREVTAIVTGKNEDTGEAQYKFGDWADVQTVLVRWRVSGGAPPYTLVLDGESRDANGEYVGESGGAFVSCALENGETYFSDRWGPMQRWHRTAPTVDSGLKTIHATVTDSNGATGSASIDVYAVRKVASDGVTLGPGKTYRLHGHLVTVPLNISVEVAYTENSDCDGPNCEGTVKALAAHSSEHSIYVGIGLRTGTEVGREHWLHGEVMLRPDDPRNKGGSAEHPLHGKLDELVESIGRVPEVGRP